MSKTISFGLSVSELDRAIKEVKEYQRELNRKVDLLVQTLVARGVEVSKEFIQNMDAIYTGELLSSISGIYDATNHVGAIYTDCEWAKFVIFGTGVRGAEAPSPYAAQVGWKYDYGNHGEAGWYYFRDGEWHWTNGFPSRDFLWDTMMVLKQELNATAKQVFGS